MAACTIYGYKSHRFVQSFSKRYRADLAPIGTPPLYPLTSLQGLADCDWTSGCLGGDYPYPEYVKVPALPVTSSLFDDMVTHRIPLAELDSTASQL